MRRLCSRAAASNASGIAALPLMGAAAKTWGRPISATPPAASAAVVAEPSELQPGSRHPQRVRAIDLNKLTYVGDTFAHSTEWQNPMEHPVWDLKEIEKVEINHKDTTCMLDKVAYVTIRLLKEGFDILAGFKFGKRDERKYINRCIFLETLAGVPGMVGGMLRHMTSLRRMQRDHGWIHTLLDEAENERMHLLTFMEMRKPGLAFRVTVLLAQGVFFNAFFLAYLISPRFCHRFVGYLEETAVQTYTQFIRDIDNESLPIFKNAKAPPLAVSYWRLPKDASFRDLIVAIRADEAGHRLVNHTFADMHAQRLENATNPFVGCHHMTATPTSGKQ